MSEDQSWRIEGTHVDARTVEPHIVAQARRRIVEAKALIDEALNGVLMEAHALDDRLHRIQAGKMEKAIEERYQAERKQLLEARHRFLEDLVAALREVREDLTWARHDDAGRRLDELLGKLTALSPK